MLEQKGWRYTFSKNATIEPYSHLIIAKSPSHFLNTYNVSSFNSENVMGELSNGKDAVALLGVDGRVIDLVRYEDSGAWPLAAG